jgi:hypothetical protein
MLGIPILETRHGSQLVDHNSSIVAQATPALWNLATVIVGHQLRCELGNVEQWRAPPRA